MNPLRPYLIGAGAVAVIAVLAWVFFKGEAVCKKQDAVATVTRTIYVTKVDDNALSQLRVDNEKLTGRLAALQLHSVHANHCPAGPTVPAGSVPSTAGAGPDPVVRPGDSGGEDDGDFDDGPGLFLVGSVAERLRNQMSACAERAAGFSH